MSWCSEDPDLLISCGKDNKLLIWNPSSDTNVTIVLLL
jgi:protein transport protein SEC31